MSFDFLIPYINYLVFLLVGIIILYVRTLIVEKAKMRVLRKRNKELVTESEEIKSRFNTELENVKKDHQLDIEKRKYQYESKQKQYLNFFEVLDSLSTDSNDSIQNEVIPIIEEFNRNYMGAANRNNKKAETKATTVFNNKIQRLIVKSNEQWVRLKNETNAIRLIGSDKVIEQLDLLENYYEQSFNLSTKLIKDLSAQIISGSQDNYNRNQQLLESMGNVLSTQKKVLMLQMRKELNEI
jgi:ribosomal protein L28